MGRGYGPVRSKIENDQQYCPALRTDVDLEETNEIWHRNFWCFRCITRRRVCIVFVAKAIRGVGMIRVDAVGCN